MNKRRVLLQLATNYWCICADRFPHHQFARTSFVRIAWIPNSSLLHICVAVVKRVSRSKKKKKKKPRWIFSRASQCPVSRSSLSQPCPLQERSRRLFPSQCPSPSRPSSDPDRLQAQGLASSVRGLFRGRLPNPAQRARSLFCPTQRPSGQRSIGSSLSIRTFTQSTTWSSALMTWPCRTRSESM